MVGVVAYGRLDLPPGPAQRAFFSYTGRDEFTGERFVSPVNGASSPDAFADQVRQVTDQGADCRVVVPLSRVLDRSSGLEPAWKRIG